MEVFNAILSSTLSLREEAHQEVSKNIARAQEKQQKDYNRRHAVPTSLKIKNKVWLKNQRRQDRKGGKGPYTIEHITKKGLCTLKNERSTVLAKKFNVDLLKPYLDPLAVDPQDEEKPHAVPPDEKPVSTQSEECIQTKANEWRHLPDEIVQMMIALAVQSSKEPVSTFNHLSLTCSRFNTIIQKKSHHLLPNVHIQFSEKVYQKLSQYNGKIKVGARKIENLFEEHSGISIRILEAVNNRKWKSSWLLLESEKHSMYRIRKVYWKSIKNPIAIKDEASNKAPNTEEQF